MIAWVYQQCKYKIKNIKNWLVLTKDMSETRFKQNWSLMLNWSVTKNLLQQKEHAFIKQP